jgi:hypothetical protein
LGLPGFPSERKNAAISIKPALAKLKRYYAIFAQTALIDNGGSLTGIYKPKMPSERFMTIAPAMGLFPGGTP